MSSNSSTSSVGNRRKNSDAGINKFADAIKSTRNQDSNVKESVSLFTSTTGFYMN